MKTQDAEVEKRYIKKKSNRHFFSKTVDDLYFFIRNNEKIFDWKKMMCKESITSRSKEVITNGRSGTVSYRKQWAELVKEK
jgi:hypothetical protein